MVYRNNAKTRVPQSKARYVINLSGALFFCLILSAVSYCKKTPKPLSHPPHPSSFVWGKDIGESVAKLQAAGWNLKSQNKQEAILIAPLEALGKEKDLAVLKDIKPHEAPDLAQVSLYPGKGKLMLSRLSRIDTKEQISQYRKRLLKAYGLKKALWSAQGKTSQDEIGNRHKSQSALYEQKELFVLVRYSSMEAVEKDLAKGRNYNIEALFYSKSNPGLTSQSLLKQLKEEVN